MKNLFTLVIAFLFIAFKTQAQSPPSSGASETHNFKTYDTVFKINYQWSSSSFGLRVTRPVDGDIADRPAIIMMGGVGEIGSNNALTAVNGPHYWLAHGWDGGVKLGNGTHYPIIISVQAYAAWPQTSELLMVLTHILNTYHIKRNSVHLTGLSMGAFSWTSLICHQSTPGGEDGMKLITSIAALEGQSQTVSTSVVSNELPGYTSFGHWAKKYHGKFFGLEGTADYRGVAFVSKPMNDSVPGSAYFSYENIGGGSHCCWNSMYDPSATNWTSVGVLGPNNARGTYPNTMGTYSAPSGIFQWMLRQGDTSMVAASAVSQPPVVNAGAAQSITLPASQVSLSGSATAPNGGTISSYKWTEVSGPAALITSPSSVSTSVTGLSTGVYVFQLLVTDNAAHTGTSTVQVTVNAAPAPVVTPPAPVVTPPLPVGSNNSGATWIKKVVVTEYRTWYIRNDSTVYAFNNGSRNPVVFPIGGRKAIMGVGGFNVFRVLDDQGFLWTSKIDYTTNTVRTDVDVTGAPFGGNVFVDAYGNTTATIRTDGSIWYMGDDNYLLFHTTGTANILPTQLSPSGMRFKKVLLGGLRIVALTTDGQVWQWPRSGSRTPIQMTIPRPASDIFVSHLDVAGCIIPDAPGATMGYPYVWGTKTSMYGGGASNTQPTSIKGLWNMSVPIKEICASWNTIHYIDSLGRMYGCGFNSMGEVGNGEEFVNKYNYPGFPGYGWTFMDYENPSGIPVQIGAGITWKHIYSNNWYAFYKYAQDVNDSVYSWGRNKSLDLGNGYYNMSEQYSYDAMDVIKPTMVHPLTAIYQQYNFTKPTITAGPKQTIASSTAVLTGVATPPLLIKNSLTAANGIDKVGYDIVSYKWTKVSGTGGTITTPNSASTTVTGLTAGTYVFNLITTDGNTGTLSANDTIIVTSIAAAAPVGTGAQPIPGKIEAESYSSTSGTKTQPAMDINGGLNVGWITYGSWMDYNVNVAAAGTYTVGFRVATINTNSTFELRNSSGTTLASIKLINSTGGYQVWQTVSTTVTLPAGIQTLRIFSTCYPYWNINWMEFVTGTTAILSVSNNASSQPLSTLATKNLSNTPSSFIIYPNPVKDNIILEINNQYTGVMNIQLVDQSGKTKSTWLINKPSQSSQVNLVTSDLSKGVYFIRVQIGAWSETKKLLKL
jgi:endoglucanase